MERETDSTEREIEGERERERERERKRVNLAGKIKESLGCEGSLFHFLPQPILK